MSLFAATLIAPFASNTPNRSNPPNVRRVERATVVGDKPVRKESL